MLKKIPLWGWVAGGGVLLVGALMLTSRRAPSSGSGESSPFTETLAQLMTALSNLQGSLQKGGGGGGGTTGATGTAGAVGGTGGTGTVGSTGNAGIPGTSEPTLIAPTIKSTPIAPTGHTSTSSATSTPLIKASSSKITTSAPLVSNPDLVKITSGRYTGKSIPIDDSSKVVNSPIRVMSYIGKSVPISDPRQTIKVTARDTTVIRRAVTSVAVKKPSPSTVKITSGRYAGKSVPI